MKSTWMGMALLLGACAANGNGSATGTSGDTNGSTTSGGTTAGTTTAGTTTAGTTTAGTTTAGTTTAGTTTAGTTTAGTTTSGTTNSGGTTSPGGPVPDAYGLPSLPELSHVQALVRGSSARITFDPYAAAKDYRVYLAPSPSDVLTNSDGSLAGIKNATYRCAGYRSASQVFVGGDGGPEPLPDWIFTNTIVAGSVAGVTRAAGDATLGYAFSDAAAGLVPVYAVGDPGFYADEFEYGVREPQTRSKRYVLDPSSYLAMGWRDGGVAFYAPASSSICATVQIQTADNADSSGPSHLYFAAGSTEAGSRTSAGNAFLLCAGAATHSEPVLRTYYDLVASGAGHDELSLGQERFDRARCQGSEFGACAGVGQSAWEAHWSNITGPVTLIVEALDAGCPFQSLMGSAKQAAYTQPGNDSTSEPLDTLDGVRATAVNGEVFINGQFDNPSPRPIARSAVQVMPVARPAMDFASNFAGPSETFTKAADCGLAAAFAAVGQSAPYQCQDDAAFSSPTYTVMARGLEVFGIFQGELSSFLGGGAFRISPKMKGSVAADSFLHVALEASSFTTDRRYPQLIVSQQDMMTSQWLLWASDDTNSAIQPVLILQPFDQQRKLIQLQLCSGRRWDVNFQCPYFLLQKQDPTAQKMYAQTHFLSGADPIEHLQTDDSARYDLYLSTKRAYVYFEDLPFGCVDLEHRSTVDSSGATISPPTQPPSGAVSVAAGMVLYHPAAQGGLLQLLSPFHLAHEFGSDLKHFDYLAFKSGEAAPAWDETRLPCVTQITQNSIPGEP